MKIVGGGMKFARMRKMREGEEILLSLIVSQLRLFCGVLIFESMADNEKVGKIRQVCLTLRARMTKMVVFRGVAQFG